MKISTEIQSIANIVGDEKAIELVAKAGFDAWDFSMFSMCKYDWNNDGVILTDHPLSSNEYLKYARKLRKIGEDNGIVCNQSHAPFPTHSDKILPYMFRSIECTAEAGGEICVIHPHALKSPEVNFEFYSKLLPFAKDCGVKIATENMWDWDCELDQAKLASCSNPEDFLKNLNLINDDYFVACLDIGHAEMKGLGTTAVEMIKALGKKLECLHIHDNDKWHDSHQIPFSMSINFDEVVNALKEIDYKGYLTLEANGYQKGFTKDNVFDAVKDLAGSVKRLANMF